MIPNFEFPDIAPIDAFCALASDVAPVIIDIRLPEDRDTSLRIPTAQDVAFDDLQAQLALIEGRDAIVVCHKGLKLSAGVTARLAARGIRAQRLVGGFVGWCASDLPTLGTPASTRIAIPLDASLEETIAAWATLRFDAPDAELLEVPRSDLDGVRDRFGAVAPTPTFPLPFDADISTLSAMLMVHRPSGLFPFLDTLFCARHQTFTGHLAHGDVSALEEVRP